MTDTTSIKSILVPLDGSGLAEQAIPYAATIAGTDAEIILLHVSAEGEPLRDLLGRVAVQPDEVEDVELGVGKDELKESVALWSDLLAVEPRLEVVIGDPATEILAAAERFGSSLIVVASHGRGAVARLAFGSVADKLTRSSTIPVMIVRPQDADIEIKKPSIFRIVVPYDGSDLAGEAFPVAAELAKRLKAGVHLVHAINPSILLPIATPMEPAYPAELYSDLLAEAETDAKTSLEEAKKQLKSYGLTVTFEIVSGTAFDAITDRAQDNDLIVMSSHGRTGVKRWLLGSVAEKLVREGPVPVVLVPAKDRNKAFDA